MGCRSYACRTDRACQHLLHRVREVFGVLLMELPSASTSGRDLSRRRDDADRMKGVRLVLVGHRLLAPKNARMCASLLVVLIAAGTAATLFSTAYAIGRHAEPELRFLEAGRPPTGDEAVCAYPIEYALGSSDHSDVIFLGDSVCHFGVDPVRFEKITGLSAFNLASFGFLGPVG